MSESRPEPSSKRFSPLPEDGELGSETSNVSSTPVAAAVSSILSETLSNIDFDGLLDLESDTSSSDSTPVVPWNMHAGTRNEGGNTLVTQTYTLANNNPRLSHFEWRGARRDPRKRRRRSPSPGDGNRATRGKRAARKPASKTTGIPMSRDFFLLVALCIGLACALVLLARPLISSMLFESAILPV